MAENSLKIVELMEKIYIYKKIITTQSSPEMGEQPGNPGKCKHTHTRGPCAGYSPV